MFFKACAELGLAIYTGSLLVCSHFNTTIAFFLAQRTVANFMCDNLYISYPVFNFLFSYLFFQFLPLVEVMQSFSLPELYRVSVHHAQVCQVSHF